MCFKALPAMRSSFRQQAVSSAWLPVSCRNWPFFDYVQYYDDAAGILRMVILSAIQPHRLLAAPPLPVTQHPCEVLPGEPPEGSQHGHMHYNMSLDDMRSQVAGEEDRCAAAALLERAGRPQAWCVTSAACFTLYGCLAENGPRRE